MIDSGQRIGSMENLMRDRETALELLNRLEIPIPHVCYQPPLDPLATCDTCVVDIEGKSPLLLHDEGKRIDK